MHHDNSSDQRSLEYAGTVPFHFRRTLGRGLSESKTASGILRQSVAARVSLKSRNRPGLECFLK